MQEARSRNDLSCFMLHVSCFKHDLMVKTRVKYIILILLLGFLPSACAVKKPPLPKILLNEYSAQEMKKSKLYWIEVQIPQRKLVLAKGDHIIKTFPIAVGQPNYPTPVGLRKINRVVWNPWWYPPKGSKWVEDSTPVPPRSPGNPLGEVKMPLGRAYLIHGTKAVRSIGRWASHGCIRMLFEDIFSLTQLLMTEYSKTSAIDAMEKANKQPHRQFYTALESDIPVVLSYDLVKVHDDYAIISPDLYNRHRGKTAQHIAEVIAPHFKKDKVPSLRKIKNLLKVFRGQSVMIPLADLATNRDTSEKEERKAQKEKEKEEKRALKEKEKKEKEQLKAELRKNKEKIAAKALKEKEKEKELVAKEKEQKEKDKLKAEIKKKKEEQKARENKEKAQAKALNEKEKEKQTAEKKKIKEKEKAQKKKEQEEKKAKKDKEKKKKAA